MNKKTGVISIDSTGLLECPNCYDGMELKHDGESFYETKCSMCNGTAMLDQKQSDGLRKLRACYQKTKQSNVSSELLKTGDR